MKIRLPDKLHDVFASPARYRGAFGGRGSGKSFSFATMALVRGMQDKLRILCAREIQTTIRESVLQELVSAIEYWGLESFYDYGASYVSGINGTEFIFKGLRHNYKEVKSTKGINICWVEEAEAVSDESWRVLIPTIREEGSEIWMTWNPEDPDAATQKRFIDNPPPRTKIAQMNYRDNPWFPEVLDHERLHDLATLDKHMYCHIWEGGCIVRTGMEVYHAFSQENVSEIAEFDPALPILLSCDFNIGEGKPMSSCLCQIKRGPDKDGKIRPELHVFDEIILETADTNDAANEMKHRYPKHPVIVYGDASGRSRDTRSKTTDYLLLASHGFSNQKVPGQNPPIRDRHNAMNGLMKSASGDVRLFVHPRCKVLIKGLERVKIKKGSGYLEEETYEQHVTTSLGYLVHYEFPVAGRAMKKIQIGGV